MENQFKSAVGTNNAYSVAAAAIERIDEILEVLDLGLIREGDRFFGCCPMHGGDAPRAFSMYANSGSWRCFTNNCHENCKPTLLNLISHVLGKNFPETLNWCVKFLGGHIKDVSHSDNKLRNVEGIYSTVEATANKKLEEIEIVRSKLIIPCEYFIKRGLDKEVLKLYDIGLPKINPPWGTPFHDRVVVPVKNELGAVIGYSGRSIHEKCDSCGGYHEEMSFCPKIPQPKWRHHGFNSGHALYGIDLAEPFIKESREIIICEGPADVWRLKESGINNAVALFGTTILDAQEFSLSRMGVFNVLNCVDNDEAGENGASKTAVKLARSFNVKRVKPTSKDWGEMSVGDIKEIFKCKE